LFSEPARFVLHPTDFSPESEAAFAHALRVALTNKAELCLMHVGAKEDTGWERFPPVRQTLQRWGLLEADARRQDVSKLGVGIEKVIVDDRNVGDAISRFTYEHPVDLLVLATEGRRGPAAWLKPSTAETAARKASITTLFVPNGSRGCVALEDGHVTMDQVLVPVDHQPPAEAAIEHGLRAISAFGHEQSKLTLLHVGQESRFPFVRMAEGPWPVTRAARQGKPVTEILAAADESMANLIIMVTKGTEGFLDILRGTTTEQVLRQSPCPVLSVPADF
jgi:nucleotide-binding universal stress UspA family protein